MKHIFSLWSLLKTSLTSIGGSWSSTSNTTATRAPQNLFFFLLSPPPASLRIERQSCQASLPTLLSSYFFSSRLICQRVSPSHHSVWQTESSVTPLPLCSRHLQPAGTPPATQPSHCKWREAPCLLKQGGNMRGIFYWLRSLPSHVVISIAISGCKVNFNCRDEVWPWSWSVILL